MGKEAVIPIMSVTLLAAAFFTPAPAQEPVPGLMNVSVGDSGVFVAVDATGNSWQNVFRIAGTAEIQSTGHSYWVFDVGNVDPEFEVDVFLGRSTPTEFHQYVGFDQEMLDFQDAPVGTTWTREYPDGAIDEVRVEAIETVTVPAGTFTDCIKFRKRCLTCSHPNPEWIEWLKPGFFLVKWVDYFVDSAHNPPVVYELTEFVHGGSDTDDDEDGDEDEEFDDLQWDLDAAWQNTGGPQDLAPNSPGVASSPFSAPLGAKGNRAERPRLPKR